jgi:hypothetical protein
MTLLSDIIGFPFDLEYQDEKLLSIRGHKTIRLDETRSQIAALLGAGFVNYPPEWWHWSFGDKYWAYMTGKGARYEALDEEEAMRLAVASA